MFVRIIAAIVTMLTFGIASAQEMIRLDQVTAEKYTASCKKEGLTHSCTGGMVVAVTPEGGLMCRPSPKTLPFAKKGEVPCVSDGAENKK